jgi:NAD(P)-dependent dehydrogenase (short-subunit alcohol dehydrogenase family)
MKLTGKIAVVTGASRGIGKAIVTRLASEGAIVAINYRSDAQPAEALVSELNEQGFRATAFRADMSKPEECQALLEDVVKAFGKVDILVSNAGIEHFGKLEEITKEDFDRVFSTNVAGQLFVTQAAARYLPSGGRIVLTSSVSAKISVFHHTLYAASKAAQWYSTWLPNWESGGLPSMRSLQAVPPQIWRKKMGSYTRIQLSKRYRQRLCSRVRHPYNDWHSRKKLPQRSHF